MRGNATRSLVSLALSAACAAPEEKEARVSLVARIKGEEPGLFRKVVVAMREGTGGLGE
jgi:hypothetical protein